LPIHEVWDLRERQLSAGAVANFHEAVRATWEDFGFAHPGGETNREAQRRSAAVCRELVTREAGRRVVVSTHGSLLALLLNSFDANVGFEFWTRISVPDVYALTIGSRKDEFTIRRIWQPAAWRSRSVHRRGHRGR
jgi:2,3-bisphosphoglycerate-dependent phosphoglycerate mutase